MKEHQGILYARVTEVLQPFADFSHIDPEVLKNKQRIGTNVHMAIADDIEGECPILKDDERGYFRSYQIWRNYLEVKFIASEQRYYNKEKRLTGQIDSLILPPGDTLPVLVDFKTSAIESKLSWTLQAHLYAYLIKSEGKSIANTYLFVKLDKKGDVPQVFQYKFDQNTMNRALLAVDEFWQNKEKEEKEKKVIVVNYPFR